MEVAVGSGDLLRLMRRLVILSSIATHIACKTFVLKYRM